MRPIAAGRRRRGSSRRTGERGGARRGGRGRLDLTEAAGECCASEHLAPMAPGPGSGPDTVSGGDTRVDADLPSVTNTRPSSATGLMSARCSTGRPSRLRLPDKRPFIRSTAQQVVLAPRLRPSGVFMRHARPDRRSRVNLAVERGDQCRLVQPAIKRERVRHFRERDGSSSVLYTRSVLVASASRPCGRVRSGWRHPAHPAPPIARSAPASAPWRAHWIRTG